MPMEVIIVRAACGGLGLILYLIIDSAGVTGGSDHSEAAIRIVTSIATCLPIRPRDNETAGTGVCH